MQTYYSKTFISAVVTLWKIYWLSQQTVVYSKSTKETLGNGVKYVQSEQ